MDELQEPELQEAALNRSEINSSEINKTELKESASEPNTKLKLAYDFVANTNKSVYLTGKAGTGKTTFLHKLRTSLSKRMLVTAPTGVAAINARGVTLHSFFQLPFGPFIPDSSVVNRRFNREKMDIIKSLHLLIIDEISMVRADMLDAVDSVLRRYRRSSEPFGGVQLLMIGDLHQLPPVIKPDEQSILENTYSSLYFFGSLALQKTPYVSIELDYIYRQSDPQFIDLLNRVRNNTLRGEDLQLLNSRCQPEQQGEGDELPITLSTHNATADNINRQHMDALNSPVFQFRAEIADVYPEHAYPAEENLALKRGAQVMFTRNDPSPEKRFFNGKMGVIVELSHERIRVKCSDDAELIEVKPATWENISFHMDSENNMIENIDGTFTQYPLRLAWAITIHKSQGLTFDRVTLDMNSAFAHGQIYVAMSRCRSLEGISLYQAIDAGAVKTDQVVSEFTQQAQDNAPSQEQLQQAKIHYQHSILLDCFRFNRLAYNFNQLARLLNDRQQLLRYRATKSLEDMQSVFQQSIVQVSQKFGGQLQQLFSQLAEQQSQEPVNNALIQERIQKASHYFLPLLNDLHEWLQSLSFEGDNQELLKNANKQRQFLREGLVVFIAGVASCQQGFSTSTYLNAISKADLQAKPVNASTKAKMAEDWNAEDLEHPKLYQQLNAWRDKAAETLQIARPSVMHLRVVYQIAKQLPLTKTMMRRIPGVGKKTIENYSEDILAIVNAYCRDQSIDVEANIEAFNNDRRAAAAEKVDQKNSAPHTKKPNTKDISFELFQSGLSIKEVAEKREMVYETIFWHLAHFVEQGTLEPGKLMDVEKIPAIEEVLKEHAAAGLKVVKDLLGDRFSYADIKIAQSYLACRERS